MSELIAETRSPQQALDDQAIHLWLLSLDADAETLEASHKRLSTEEQQRASRFLSEPARQRFVLTRSALRRILHCYAPSLPQPAPLAAGEFGKPFLDTGRTANALSFNVSHAGNRALLGFCRGTELGVDVEQERDLPELMGIARRVFSDREYAWLEARSVEERAIPFFRLWTCKEAALKSEGRGFHRDPSTLSLAELLEDEDPTTRRFDQEGLTVAWVRPDDGYPLAWATRMDTPLSVRWIQPASRQRGLR
ncbi:MAG: 4'-phosphopantetheinyl transferase superfamily protein [Pseudomonadota bacterium]